MENILHDLKHSLDRAIWRPDLRKLQGVRRWALTASRMIYVVVRDLLDGELNLRAMSLVYTTLLSIVPLLAVVFSVLKAFGMHQTIAPFLRDFFSPLGADGTQLADDVVGFVEKVQVGLLGALGVLLLIYTAVSLMYKIEVSLNFVWRIDGVRSLARRFSSFLSLILVGPVLVLGAVGITASLRSTRVVREIESITLLGGLVQSAAAIVPYVLVWIAFLLVYLYVPNTRVRFRAALTGGIVAAVMWQSAGLVFAAFIASSTRYAVIYSSFAMVILALIWIYLNWVILLLGAGVSFYVQNPHFLTRQPVRLTLSNRMRESLSLAAIYLIGDHYLHDKPPHTVESLAERLELPPGPVEAVLSALHEAGFVERTADDPPGYLPARDLGRIPIRELLASVRRVGETPQLNVRRVAMPDAVRQVAIEAVDTVASTLGERTVRDLFPAPEDDREGEEPEPRSRRFRH